MPRSPRTTWEFGTRYGLPLVLGSAIVAVVLIDAAAGLASRNAPVLAGLGLLAVLAMAVGQARLEHRLWVGRVHELVDRIDSLADHPERPIAPSAVPEFAEMVQAVESLRREVLRLREAASRSGEQDTTSLAAPPGNGRFDSTAEGEVAVDPLASGEFSLQDMIVRLDPASLRWVEASVAAQEFFGWSIRSLREMSFLDVIHPEHRDLAREQLRASLHKGEAHGLVYRVVTAKAEERSVEMNVGVRYGPDRKVAHLRGHITDVTAKLRASRELRRRTRELTVANEQLRRVNRELQEMKDRYGDLYQNAPAMYFSLDEHGAIRECNNTLLRALGYRREDLIGRPYTNLMPEPLRPHFPERFREFLEHGTIEIESRWVKADGTELDVWVSGTAVFDVDGRPIHSRSVAQDVTARHALEAQLQEKNTHLARANDELSAKNRELDDYSYVVSHDLQEPLRTLIAFSDFLETDCGDRLDATGREYLRHIVEAARRMRALIRDLLALGRAGRVCGERAEVDLDPVLSHVTADLAELIRSRNAEVRILSPLSVVWGDRDRIGQLFLNLVTNGLKYNRSERPTIDVGLLDPPVEAEATLYVRDNGIGIDPRFHDRIFQMFRRLHTREEYEGTGAGLAICEKIVRAHGGRIRVESRDGEGSTFYVSLPRP